MENQVFLGLIEYYLGNYQFQGLLETFKQKINHLVETQML